MRQRIALPAAFIAGLLFVSLIIGVFMLVSCEKASDDTIASYDAAYNESASIPLTDDTDSITALSSTERSASGSITSDSAAEDDAFMSDRTAQFSDSDLPDVAIDTAPVSESALSLHPRSEETIGGASDEVSAGIPDTTKSEAPDTHARVTPETVAVTKETAASEAEGVLSSELNDALAKALSYLKGTSRKAAYGSEWSMISLCLEGYADDALREAYIASVIDAVSLKLSESERLPATALDKHKATENARVILALLAAGADPADVGGYDLVSALCDADWVCSGTLNCPIYALIALDACGSGHNAVKNSLVDYILSRQLDDGGWALSGTKADPDVTAMALQAFCRHRDRSDVLAAASRAIDALAKMQLDTGEYRSWGTVNSESISQVVIALSAWGIDPAGDERFTKSGGSAIDALLCYVTEDGFADTKPGSGRPNSGETNRMACEQASLAILAYSRFLFDGGSIYDLK